MELLDLWSLEKWRAFEAAMHEKSGLNASVFNTDGIRITEQGTWPNRLCPQIKADPKGKSFICAAAHMNIAQQAKTSRAPQIEECDAGMVKLIVPIFVGDQFVGAVGACGHLLDDGEVDTFLVDKMTDLDADTIDDLTKGIPTITSEQARELINFIQTQLDAIVASQ